MGGIIVFVWSFTHAGVRSGVVLDVVVSIPENESE